MKSYSRVLVLLMLITAVLLVACGGEDSASEPTPLPEPDIPMTVHESEAGGYTIDYPEEWFVSDLFGMGIISSMDTEAEEMDDMGAEGAVVIVMGGPQEAIGGNGDPMVMLDEATANFDVESGAMEIVSEPTAVTINGANAAQMSVRGESEGNLIYASITVLANDMNGVIAMAITPVAEEETNAPIFDMMFDSIIVSEEEIINSLGEN